MDSGDALHYLTPQRAALALSAAVLRCGAVDRKFLRILHTHVQASRECSFPTFTELIASYSHLPFQVYSFDDPRTESWSEFTNEQISAILNAENTGAVLHNLVESAVKHVHGLTVALDLVAAAPAGAFPIVARDSPVDLFLRKIAVAYVSLNFEALTELNQRLKRYADGDNTQYSAEVPASVARSAIAALEHVSPLSESHHKLLRTAHTEASGDLPPHPDIMPSPSLANVEYALSLEAGQRRDSSSAIDLLHRAFDLSLAAPPAPKATASLSRFPLLPRRKREAQDPPSRGIHDERPQYAALALAALYTRSGALDAASSALDDAMRLAQHHGDDAAQRQVLGWYVHTSARPERRRELVSRVGDPVAEAEDDLRVALPCDSHERAAAVSDRTGLHTGDLRPSSLLVSAASWETYGSLPTALAVARAAYRVSEREGGLERARALAAVAALTARVDCPSAGVKLLEDELGDATDGPVYDEEFGDKPTEFPVRDLLRKSLAWLRFQRAIARHELRDASNAMRNIEAYAFCAAGGRGLVAEAKLDALEAQGLYEFERGDYNAAVNHAHEERRTAADNGLPARVIRGGIAVADGHLRGIGTLGFKYSVRAGALAERLGFPNLVAEAALRRAHATIRIHSPEEAARVLLPALPTALSLGPATRAYARIVHAMLMIERCESAPDREAHDKLMADACVELEDAVALHRKAETLLELRDTCNLLARAYNAIGDLKNRDRIAGIFREAEMLRRKRIHEAL